MPYIQRELQPQITRETPPKAVVIFGARQIGKTTLLTELSQYEKSVRWFNGDLIADHRQLQFSSSTDVELTLRQADTIIIDEAQRFPNIGLILKQLVDVNVRLNLGKKIFATGSSSLELAKGVKESAVGRLVHRQMWPLSISEIAAAKGWGEISQNIERLMIYGTYPAVFTDPDHAESTLRNYCDGVLYKDLFALAGIRQNEKFMHLVKLLAYNVGSEVNYDNLARDTGLSRTTVADYLQLLEQCFIVRICSSFSRSLSNELKKGKKVYSATTASETPSSAISDSCPRDAVRTPKPCGRTSSTWNASSCTAFETTSPTCTSGARSAIIRMSWTSWRSGTTVFEPLTASCRRPPKSGRENSAQPIPMLPLKPSRERPDAALAC